MLGGLSAVPLPSSFSSLLTSVIETLPSIISLQIVDGIDLISNFKASPIPPPADFTRNDNE